MSNIINVEIKSRCKNPNEIENILRSNNAIFKGLDHQIDTYFNTKNGRLKLRQGIIENSLIFYDRSNEAKSRESHIILEKLPDETNLLSILNESIGTKITVDKKRKIYFIDNVKFHVDSVKGLGEFVEIEAICDDGSIPIDQLKEQCDYYIDKLSLKKKDFIELSYSDLVNEGFEERINREAINFLDNLLKQQLNLNIDFAKLELDHLCYRVTSDREYVEYKERFSKFAKLLVESEVGGRLIATYKLTKSISWKKREISIIELPSPKKFNKYALGFEHAEYIICESFASFKENHLDLSFDTKSESKEINPDIRLEFPGGESAKFHHQSLESVIEYEKSML